MKLDTSAIIFCDIIDNYGDAGFCIRLSKALLKYIKRVAIFTNKPSIFYKLIGENNLIREYVTINPGTEGGGLKTKIGNNCLFMISSHVAHDCKIGNNVLIGTNSSIKEGITICNDVIIGMNSNVTKDIKTPGIYFGNPLKIYK